MTNDQRVQGVERFSTNVKSFGVVGVKGVEGLSTYVKAPKSRVPKAIELVNQ